MGVYRHFPYSNFHEMNLDEILKILREMEDEWNTTKTEWNSYKDFIDNYFANLDVSDEVLQALRTMAGDGSLNTIIDPVIANAVTTWLTQHITPTTPAIDKTLTVSDAGADAKVVGNKFKNVYENFDSLLKYADIINFDNWEIGTIDATSGEDIGSVNYIRSPFFLFNGKVDYIGTLATPGSNEARQVFMYAYDKNHTYISRLAINTTNNGQTWETPEGTCYVRFTYGFTNASTVTVATYGFDNLVNDWEMVLYPRHEIEPKTEYGFVGAMLKCTETYFKEAYDNPENQIVYDTYHGIFTYPKTDEDINATVCSQFTKSQIMGIPYEYSKYVQNENNRAWWGYEYEGFNGTPSSEFWDSDGYLTSWEMAKYFDDLGLLATFDPKHNNIRPGDIMFFGTDTAIENINHCCICLFTTDNGFYTPEAGGNAHRPLDNKDVGIGLDYYAWTNYTPTFYARVPMLNGEYTNELVLKDDKGSTGSYNGNEQLLYRYQWYPRLADGFYTIMWEGTSTDEIYLGIDIAHAERKYFTFNQGTKHYCVFYPRNVVRFINFYATGVGTFEIKNVRLYKGYKIPF